MKQTASMKKQNKTAKPSPNAPLDPKDLVAKQVRAYARCTPEEAGQALRPFVDAMGYALNVPARKNRRVQDSGTTETVALMVHVVALKLAQQAAELAAVAVGLTQRNTRTCVHRR